MDTLFSVNSIKVPYSGATYKEINDNIKVALERKNVELVIRCLDMDRFFDEANSMRTDLGAFPVYLHNQNYLDDVNYVLNRDVIYGRCLPMIKNRNDGMQPGITSFDDYSNWMANYTFGKNEVLASKIEENSRFSRSDINPSLTDEEKAVIKENIELNVTSLADKYPNVKFYYFFPVYSAAWWEDKMQEGSGKKWIEAEQHIIELILLYSNIYLFSWNDRFDITTNLNNYKDVEHYGEWVNSWMLLQMKNVEGKLTKQNYEELY